MKNLIVGAAIAAIATVSYIASSADSTDLPIGVSARNWIPVGDSVGIVLGSGSEATVESPGSNFVVPSNALLLVPPIGGYFMVKSASGWRRLVVIEPAKGPGDAG